MIDPDHARPVLRLGDVPAKQRATDAECRLADEVGKRLQGCADRAKQDAAVKAALHAPVERLTSSDLLALRERQMEEAIKAWVSATIDYAAERRQSQPIPAAQPEKAFHRLFDGFKPVGDGAVRYERPKIFRADGTVDHLNGYQSLDAPL